MTRDETKQILMRIQTTYPNWKPQADLSLVIDVWHEYLEGYEYKDILYAVKSFVLTDTEGFAPSVGQVLGQLRKVAESDELSGLEAWALVSNALRNGYYGAEKEYDKLPPLVQKAVGTPENLRHWSQTDLKSIETVVMSQFLTAYKTVTKRASEFSVIPSSVRLEMQKRMMLEQKEEVDGSL